MRIASIPRPRPPSTPWTQPLCVARVSRRRLSAATTAARRECGSQSRWHGRGRVIDSVCCAITVRDGAGSLNSAKDCVRAMLAMLRIVEVTLGEIVHAQNAGVCVWSMPSFPGRLGALARCCPGGVPIQWGGGGELQGNPRPNGAAVMGFSHEEMPVFAL